MYAIRNIGEERRNPGTEPLAAAVRGEVPLALPGEVNAALPVARDLNGVAGAASLPSVDEAARAGGTGPSGEAAASAGGARVLSYRLDAEERVVVRVKHGHAWATLEGDPEDYVIAEGEPRAFIGPGLLVVQGLEPGAVAQILGGRALLAAAVAGPR